MSQRPTWLCVTLGIVTMVLACWAVYFRGDAFLAAWAAWICGANGGALAERWSREGRP